MQLRGRVKWYSKDKGYGFVAPDDGSADVFVHSEVVKSCDLRVSQIQDGTPVIVEVIDNKGRSRATSIALAK